MSYIGIPPFGQTLRSVTNITATAGQTTFNIVGGYQQGYVDVFLNGVLLVPGTDYTATDGLTVVLTSGAALNDEFQALSYQPVSLVDVYTQPQTNTLLDAKQNTLVSGTNIKTVGGESLLGSGDVPTLPDQTSQSGKFLTTDGTDASWASVDALPSQSGQSGKFLSTDGTNASWETVSVPVTSVAGKTGAVTLDKADVGLGNVANVDQQNASNLTSGTVGTARLGSGTANSSTFLRGDGSWQTPPAPTITTGQQTFTSNGTFTIPSGVTAVTVTVVGGGGGGNNTSSSGGGGGGAAIKLLTGLTPGNTLSVTVGGGGGTTGSGGTSSVSSGSQSITTISATGGAVGVSAPTPGADAGRASRAMGGLGGIGSNGDVNIAGGCGEAGFAHRFWGGGIDYTFGNGGKSMWGGPGGTGTASATGRQYGGGGAGSAGGAAGVVRFQWGLS
jgi:hypothetical protein